MSPSGVAGYTPFGYAGSYTDPDGLLYLINRYYDPNTGQFISIDPKVSQSQEPYSYADGDPISQVDPAGLSSINLDTWPRRGEPCRGNRGIIRTWCDLTVGTGERITTNEGTEIVESWFVRFTVSPYANYPRFDFTARHFQATPGVFGAVAPPIVEIVAACDHGEDICADDIIQLERRSYSDHGNINIGNKRGHNLAIGFRMTIATYNVGLVVDRARTRYAQCAWRNNGCIYR